MQSSGDDSQLSTTVHSKFPALTINCNYRPALAVSLLSLSICPAPASICWVTRPCLSFWWRTSARFVVKCFAHPAVVQMNVVSVTEVHDIALHAKASLLVASTGKATPGEECSLDIEPRWSGFEELNTGKYAPTCTNRLVMYQSQTVTTSHVKVISKWWNFTANAKNLVSYTTYLLLHLFQAISQKLSALWTHCYYIIRTPADCAEMWPIATDFTYSRLCISAQCKLCKNGWRHRLGYRLVWRGCIYMYRWVNALVCSRCCALFTHGYCMQHIIHLPQCYAAFCQVTLLELLWTVDEPFSGFVDTVRNSTQENKNIKIPTLRIRSPQNLVSEYWESLRNVLIKEFIGFILHGQIALNYLNCWLHSHIWQNFVTFPCFLQWQCAFDCHKTYRTKASMVRL